jgi:hypothetical protein
MARAKTVSDTEGRFYGIRFNCPGCALADGFSGVHILPVKWTPPGREQSSANAGQAHWDFNGDMEKPTFGPSILTRQDRAGVPFVCHSFIREGMIEFLGDCTHELAGKTVPLPDLQEPDPWTTE